MFMWTTWAHTSFDTIQSNRHPFCADYLLVIYIAFVSKNRNIYAFGWSLTSHIGSLTTGPIVAMISIFSIFLIHNLLMYIHRTIELHLSIYCMYSCLNIMYYVFHCQMKIKNYKEK